MLLLLVLPSPRLPRARTRFGFRRCNALLYNEEREHQPSLSLSLSGTDYSLSRENVRWCHSLCTARRERAEFVVIANRRSLSRLSLHSRVVLYLNVGRSIFLVVLTSVSEKFA